ncbi:ESX secretion-associated protein EspG [Mycobacterium talmoniae]|uniref:ESX secretion-associated protein EspG n=1 Tax=Mycobacterium talmoniae TaxID=1858794 RepID=A0A1S1NBI6_9MYCO|nr:MULTISPECIES: ESX secretion-associated protein EspG [Mycobacterium]OHU97497.1 ESX secretion-associated protein EspG [Mycobacterium talmoniae]PQM49592.1 ESX-5 secretion-associated protein EspG5 [Mycobacterium talmoniae]TDH46236.1 ESX secretion-associated protein EspG [Mycobacterium eburneum]
MLTTAVDGLWALQVLSGIEALAPELALRPILPSVETKPLALAHPVCAALRSAGVIDDAGVVDPTVVEWLTVVARRDIALLIQLRLPGDDPPARVLLARFARWWVVMERSEDLVRIGGAGTAGAEDAADTVVATQLQRLCGRLAPAPLRPVTVDADALAANVTSRDTLRAFLTAQRLDGDQLQLLMLATDPQRSAQAAIVAIQSGLETGRPTRAQVEPSVVTIMDTPAGRVVAEHVRSAGKNWMIFAPGTSRHIGGAVNQLLRRLPANDKWFSYRKVV